jgi:hypothetical protein
MIFLHTEKFNALEHVIWTFFPIVSCNSLGKSDVLSNCIMPHRAFIFCHNIKIPILSFNNQNWLRITMGTKHVLREVSSEFLYI